MAITCEAFTVISHCLRALIWISQVDAVREVLLKTDYKKKKETDVSVVWSRWHTLVSLEQEFFSCEANSLVCSELAVVE